MSHPRWGDLLISYCGRTNAYDAVGNPTRYYNGTQWHFTWSGGRRLAVANNGTVTISFEYNGDGLRTSKTVNGVKHTYRLNGSQIVSEAWGNNLLIYLYDAEGAPVGMMYRNDSYPSDTFDTFWFEKNLQGDIVAVYDEDGTKLISYTYDAWGNFTTTYHNGCTASHIANLNPFRYRGYYYDTELGMYYLQSRYYDPIIGRFVNADALAPASQGLTGNNMFAYGGNRVVSQKYSQAGPEGRIFFGLSNNSTTTPSTSNGGFTSSGSIARAHSFNLFGGETRWSAGWEDASAFVNTGFLRLGMSSYDTHINGRDGLIYGFTGSTVDIMNLSGVTYFAGFGVNLGGMLSAEVQVENFGLSNTVTIGRFFISGGINLAGATSITIGLNTQMPDGVVHTDAFTLGINTGMVALAAMAVYAYATMGDPSYAYQFISNLFPSYAYLLA